MANLELIKENIELQIQVGSGTNTESINKENLIPDTLPDVARILSIDTEKKITKAEVADGRISVDAALNFTIVYVSEDEEGRYVNTVSYPERITSFIDISNAEQGMLCNVECELEHINPTIINERKINIDAFFKLNGHLYKQDGFDFITGVQDRNDIQILRKKERVDSFIPTTSYRMEGQDRIDISMDKNQIEEVLKFDYLLHKRDVRVSDDKLRYSCYMNVDLIYRAVDTKEIFSVRKDISITGEQIVERLTSEYDCDYDFRVVNASFTLNENDYGEKRIIDLNFGIDVDTTISKSVELDIAADAYSPERNINIIKESSNFKIKQGEAFAETITKDNINVDDDPVQILSTKGEIVDFKTKVSGTTINIDGILKLNCIYKSGNDVVGYSSKDIELGFDASIDMPCLTDDMELVVKHTLESLEAAVEAGTIAVKGIISFDAKALKNELKEYIYAIEEDENTELPVKKASIVIYVVQPDDTLWYLAKKYNTTIDAIASANNIENKDEIMVGEKLIIPGRAII